MKIYQLKFSIPFSRQNLCLGNGIYVENGDELLVMESLGKAILLNHKRFIKESKLTEVRSLSGGYYSVVKNPKKIEKTEEYSPSMPLSDKSLSKKIRVRRKKIDPT
jgi:hypothetical protein